MMGVPVTVDPNIIWESNTNGKFVMLEKVHIDGYDKTGVRIRFLDTGYETVVPYSQAKAGRVKDRLKPRYWNVGCLGNASTYEPTYIVWRGMLQRCYDINSQSYCNYGAKGVTVCDRWHIFENFVQDVVNLPGYENWVQNPSMYQIDKDLLQPNIPENMKVYSPTTCCFIHRADNIVLSDTTDKHYIGVEEDHPNSKRYRARARINGRRFNLGLYLDPVVAANAYNNFINYMYNGERQVVNDVPYMSPEEVMQYNLFPKRLYTLIGHINDYPTN